MRGRYVPFVMVSAHKPEKSPEANADRTEQMRVRLTEQGAAPRPAKVHVKDYPQSPITAFAVPVEGEDTPLFKDVLATAGWYGQTTAFYVGEDGSLIFVVLGETVGGEPFQFEGGGRWHETTLYTAEKHDFYVEFDGRYFINI